MSEEGKITVSEFKIVVESFEENQKKIVEVINYRFDKVDGRLVNVEGRLDKVENRLGTMEIKQNRFEVKTDSMMEQIALLHEGQTEIKAELRSGLKDRVTYSDFAKLEKRVVRLENKVA